MIVRRDSLEAIGFEGLSIFDYTAGTDLGSSLAVIEVPPEAAHPKSLSRRTDKYYLVVQGELQLSLQGEQCVLGPGDFCFIEQGKRFAYANGGPSPATLVLVHTPSFDLDSEVFASGSAA